MADFDLADLLSDVARESADTAARAGGALDVGTCNVLAIDLDAGLADVLIDGDDLPSSVPVVGAAPAPGSRGVILFAPPAGAYLLGGLGVAGVRVPATGDVELETDDHPFQIGDDDGPNLAFDPNEVQARDNGQASDFFVNNEGGVVHVGGVGQAGPAPDSPDDLTIAHEAQASAAGYGFRQQADGDVILNAPLGRDVFVQNDGGGTAVARFGQDGGGFSDVRFPLDLPTDGAPSGFQVYLRSADQVLYRLSSTRRDKDLIGPADPDELVDLIRNVELVDYLRKSGGPVETGILAEDAPPRLRVLGRDGLPADVNRDLLLFSLVGAVQVLLAERGDPGPRRNLHT